MIDLEGVFREARNCNKRGQYAAKKAAGICKCCSYTAEANRILCNDCRLREQEYEYRDREKRRDNGQCRTRGCPATRLMESVFCHRCRVADRIRSSLKNRFRDVCFRKTICGHPTDDLGCSIKAYIAYIESLFQPGMTWDNRGHGPGKWQIDHILALGSFDLTIREQFLIAWHYTNTRPTWCEDHKLKTDKEQNH